MKNKSTSELKAIAVTEYEQHQDRYTIAYFAAIYLLANQGVGHCMDEQGELAFYKMKEGYYNDTKRV